MTDVRTEQRSNNAPDDPGANDFLPKVSQAGISDATSLSIGPATAPRRIGSYQIISVLGKGGMGLVYLAQQQQPKRIVALKVINPGLTSLGHLRRLLREAEVLGRLQHPGIAQIYEAGTADSPDGSEPFIAMEYIRGQPITDYVRAKSLLVGSRLDLFAKVCDAIHHAHQQGIVHRDIKPANIMVDHASQPKVLDFGVARLVDNDQRITRQTEDGQFIGTLAYMSPEHASARPDQIDVRSDIYALGVVLYEVLTGKMPYCIDGCSIVDAARVIQEDDPTRLSSISKHFSGDIEVIVNKALEKNKDNRYQSAAELAADIRRHLHDQPILARAPSRRYQLQKFARRHKAFFLGLAAVFLTLIAGLIGTTWQAVQARHQATLANQNAQQANTEARESQLRLAEGMVAQGNAILMANRQADARLIYTQAWDIFDTLGVSGLPAQLGVWESDRQRPRPLRSFTSDSDCGLEIFAGDDVIASAKGPDIVLRDALTGSLLRVLEGHTGVVVAFAATEHGEQVIGSNSDGTLRIWNSSSGVCIHTISDPNSIIVHAAITPDGKHALTVNQQAQLRLGDLKIGTSTRIARSSKQLPSDLAISPDGRVTICAGLDGTITIADASEELRPRTLLGHTREIIALAYSADGGSIASASLDETVRKWNVSSGKQMLVISEPRHARCLCFSHDGRYLAFGRVDGVVKICDATSGRQISELAGHESPITHVSFSEDGRLLMSADDTGTTNIWAAQRGDEIGKLAGHSGPVYSVAMARSVPICVSAGSDGTIRIWDSATLKSLRVLDSRSGPQNHVAISSDGRMVASAGNDGSLRLWDIGTGKVVRMLPHPGGSGGITFSRDGRAVFAVWDDGSVRRWEAVGDGTTTLLANGLTCLGTIIPSADGSRLYCATDDGIKCISQHSSGSAVSKLGAGTGTVNALELSGDGNILAGGTSEGAIHLWDVKSNSMIRSFGGHAGPVTGLGFLDKDAIASSNDDGTMRIWRVSDGSEIRTLCPSGVPVLGLATDSDHMALFTATADGCVQVLDLSRPGYDHVHQPALDRDFHFLQADGNTDTALPELGAWYEAHELNNWAACLYERARGDHQRVSPLALARCYWKLHKFDLAKQEFDRALQEPASSEAYIHLCQDAVNREQRGGM